jgi:hypothetical protein
VTGAATVDHRTWRKIMQAITIAIGKTGIEFFAEHYLSNTLVTLLSKLKPSPDRNISVPGFKWPLGTAAYTYSNINVILSNGTLNQFKPIYKSITQGVTSDAKKTPIFTLTLEADNFSAQYDWLERYHWDEDYMKQEGRFQFPAHDSGDKSTSLTYTPGFGSLTSSVVVQFLFDSTKNAWEITVQDASAQTSGLQANIPAASILQHQDNSCASSHVDDVTAQAIDALDFATPINQLISGVLQTIPGSGNLGHGIVYDFSLGDSSLQFPNNDGIQMGVKGGASYNGTSFSESGPPSLPLPSPLADTDTHHVNMYVSNYEMDALHWAYFKASNLNTVVNPTDLSDPQALKVATYISEEPSLKHYSAFAMQAQITPTAAPLTTFQLLWEFTADVMTALQKQLPNNVYSLLLGLQGNAYTSQASLEQDLKDATIDPSNFAAIEDAAKSMGMVVTHNLDFKLVIQNSQPTPPDIQFSLTRTDILTNLKLGMSSNKTQTLQYDFLNVSNQATFIASTVPGFAGDNFGKTIWPVAGEPRYAQVLADMGKTGVPLPIMQDFEFDFDNAQLSIQSGYISILANIQYTGA